MNLFKDKLLNAVRSYESICILTHHEPDGDGLPAGLALKRVLSALGKKADFVLEEIAPEQFNYLQARDHTIIVNPDSHYDLVIVVDCHDVKRLGTTGFIAEKAKQCFVIDHHIAHDDIVPGADYLIQTEVSCVGIMMLNLFREELDQMDEGDRLYCAECIYTAILNDTNSFMNANTDKETLLAAAELEKFGIVYGDVTEKFIYNDPWRKLKLIGMTMSTLESHFQDKVLFINSTQAMLAECNIGIEHLTKVIGWVRSAKDILMIVYFKETADGSIKLSFRSKTINVAEIASEFGGGGHIQAAGGSINLPLNEAKQVILNRLKECNELRNYSDK
ncbi:MAG: bifunctional oligoribonuclease/PAP phosphatase NrnA [Candidatus Cloacimonetes bacterium]|nr:bifunctional oligoribonuclease/PAP phosphatase NrnA [Candidatus Cloacimonadota bacterium]